MRVLSIFNRYRHYGGEEAVAERITALLGEHMYSRSYTYSTEELIGGSLLSKITALPRSLHNKQVAKELENLQQEHRFDVWLVHNIFPGMSPLVFSTAFKLGIPVIHMVHNYRLGCINGFFLKQGAHCELCLDKTCLEGIKYKCWHNSFLFSSYNTFYQSLIRRAGIFEKTAAFIGLSQSQIPLLTKIGILEDKLSIIPHFVDIPIPVKPPVRGGNILFMGRLSREKGAHLLLQAWHRLAPQNNRLVIAGTGPEEENLKKYVSEHNLSNVDFIGFVDKDRHKELWEEASVYVMPSTWEETAAMTILEGWSYGRPAIAFDIGAAKDYINSPLSGWLAETGSEESLADALSKAINTDNEKLSAMSQYVTERVAKEHSPSVWMEQFTTLCNNITKPSR